MNRGTCEDRLGSYLCHCPQGFRGHNCETGAVFPFNTQMNNFTKVNVNTIKEKRKKTAMLYMIKGKMIYNIYFAETGLSLTNTVLLS